MHKIPTLFARDPENRKRLLPEVASECAWVVAGEGVATRKYDGTCVLRDGAGEWWARREVRPGRLAPPGYLAISTDAVTGKAMGWEPMSGSTFLRFHTEALAGAGADLAPGTYELVGPKANGNPERVARHTLLRHGWMAPEVAADFATAPRDFAALRAWVTARSYEGVVWHHPDGRKAKLKARDFGA
ncbi:hypothetical protein [Streptomyces sp. SPB074]|uniref:hypothetical protein n=1 Tax=Streptomyces sp. (strain SPB074) TaxID=465543 RepID=UPI00017F2988|nr:hypothetical protein [Streptomyces sp. SPB074]